MPSETESSDQIQTRKSNASFTLLTSISISANFNPRPPTSILNRLGSASRYSVFDLSALSASLEHQMRLSPHPMEVTVHKVSRFISISGWVLHLGPLKRQTRQPFAAYHVHIRCLLDPTAYHTPRRRILDASWICCEFICGNLLAWVSRQVEVCESM